MASRFILPFADIGDGITPSDGATLDFFDTGTSTRKNTFSDSAATIANANPVVADGDGVFPDIFIDGSYKVVLKDKNGVQQFEADPISAALDSSNSVRIFTNVAAMVASTSLSIGDFVRFEGYTTAGDGGDNECVIVAAATGTDDGGSFFDLGTNQAKALFPKNKIYAKQFGVLLDGVTDDAPEINNAITFAKTVKQDIHFSDGVCAVGTTIDLVDATGVRLIGEGAGGISNGVYFAVTGFKWIGAAAGTVVKIRSTQAATRKMIGSGLIGIGIDGASVANIGFQGTSFDRCDFDITITGCLTKGFATDCLDDRLNSGAGDPADNQANNFERIQVLARSTCRAIDIQGNAGNPGATVAANTSLNQFGIVDLNIEDGNGLHFGFSDANIVDFLRVFRLGGGTGVGLFFDEDTTTNKKHSRFNVVTLCQTAASGCTAKGGGVGDASLENTILNFSLGNTGINNMPVIESSAILHFSTGRTYRRGAAGLVVVGSSGTLTAQEDNVETQVAAAGTEAIRVFSGDSNHATFTNGTQEWDVNIDAATGDLRVIRKLGSGSLVLTDVSLLKLGAKQVSTGSVNSGEAGFRLLRVPN